MRDSCFARIRVGFAVGVLLFACVGWQPAAAHDCCGPHATLIVQVRSDLSHPDEFDSVVVSSNDGNMRDIFFWTATFTPSPGQDFATGVRVLEVPSAFHNGELRFTVSLLNGSSVVLSRPVRVTMNEGSVRVVTVLLTKETPILTWSTPPTSIGYGTPLGATQLNASASTAGSYDYSPPAGTVLPAGTHTLSVTFTPSNPAVFNSATASVSLTVIKASLIIDPDDKVRPPGIANPTLTARYFGLVTGEHPGSLDVWVSLTTPATAASPPGAYPITASGAVDANYSILFFSGTLTITEKEIPSLIWAPPSPITYGTPLGPAQLSAVPAGGVLGSFSFSPPGGTVLNTGMHPITATFTPTNTTRYETVSQSIDLAVYQAKLTITADNKTRAVGDDNPPLTATYTGFVNGDTVDSLDGPPRIRTTARASSPAGPYPIRIDEAIDRNYSITHVDGILTVLEPPVLHIVSSNEGIKISWNLVEGFKLFSSFDLIDWERVEGVTVQDEDAAYYIKAKDVASIPRRFFQLQLE